MTMPGDKKIVVDASLSELLNTFQAIIEASEKRIIARVEELLRDGPATVAIMTVGNGNQITWKR